MTRSIYLRSGEEVLVDNEDFEYLSQFRWYKNGKKWVYARRSDGGKTIQMHRELLGLVNASPQIYVDHINGNGLDNRKANLRITDNKGNQGNRHRLQGGTSKYRGVTYNKPNRNWLSRIRCNGKLYHLGSFATPEEAARCYDAWAKEHFGEFARLNIPDG